VGTVEEIARLIVFLMGDGSSFISGADIPVDGGMTAHGGVKSISDAMRTRPGTRPLTRPHRFVTEVTPETGWAIGP
jgi:hypothetical protein